MATGTCSESRRSELRCVSGKDEKMSQASSVSDEAVREVGKVLKDRSRPMKERFRALFTLRNIGGQVAIDCIADCFQDPSALLKHELAYCLGQMKDTRAISILEALLKDVEQEPMVRHEAGEALGAIGSPTVLEILQVYSSDPVIEVAETCQLAVNRIQWLQNKPVEKLSENPFSSIDPAPPAPETDVDILKARLLDESLPLFERYRAMFALRNKGDEKSILALAAGLKGSSALFRHEVAYVLGQLQNSACVPQLVENLADLEENEMVRHECAEALGAVASDECMQVLEKYLDDSKQVVKESCEIALDMCDYENSSEFQYANALLQTVNSS